MSDFKDHLLVQDDVRVEVERLLRGCPIDGEDGLIRFKTEIMLAVATARIPASSAIAINDFANEVYATVNYKKQMQIAANSPDAHVPSLPGSRDVEPLVLETAFYDVTHEKVIIGEKK
tara:strand:- start:1340 stop:1693 length:354 start_codon:yes stop_codon:yes gene_type:complete